MSKQSVSGKTKREIREMRSSFNARILNPERNFEEERCLAKIPRQPEDYDGPPRYCIAKDLYKVGDKYICEHHGGKGHGNPENMEKLANMKHGMEALRKHLVEDFTEKDRALYDWIVDSYSDAYDIDTASDPSSAYDLHVIAAEIVRAERGRGFLIEEGEVNEKKVKDEDGRVVVDESGELVTEKSEHYLVSMINTQDKKITKLEKELGVTRKERKRAGSRDDAVESITQLADLGQAFINRDEREHDPENPPWEGDTNADAD